jgi:hypothetical protein
MGDNLGWRRWRSGWLCMEERRGERRWSTPGRTTMAAALTRRSGGAPGELTALNRRWATSGLCSRHGRGGLGAGAALIESMVQRQLRNGGSGESGGVDGFGQASSLGQPGVRVAWSKPAFYAPARGDRQCRPGSQSRHATGRHCG